MNFKVLLIVSLIFPTLQGCADFDTNNGPTSGTIVMGEQDEISVGSTSNKTVIGQDITEFYCASGIKKCNLIASQKYCTCERGPIYLPPRMGL